MAHDASDLTHRLAREAEAVCRHYLCNGRREGRYWIIGDVRNTPGRSMFVRLAGPPSGKGAAGKWTDAATGEHGDLLDVIRQSSGLADFREVADEARRFLSLPHEPEPYQPPTRSPEIRSAERARRLFAIAQPIKGTLVETYLRHRGIIACDRMPALRFHPRCFYLPDGAMRFETWPAMIASVTKPSGDLTGVHRTWLSRDGQGKAPIPTPRRAMGNLLGNAVRFGLVDDVAAVGEGIETMLSLRSAMPDMPMLAALSAPHLAAILLPVSLRRLYIARDNDAAGIGASTRLEERTRSSGIETAILTPELGDFNDDLRRYGLDQLRARLTPQLCDNDRRRFIPAG